MGCQPFDVRLSHPLLHAGLSRRTPDADRFRYRGWAAEGPKRYLAGAIVVGTIDQVLLSSLMVGHAHMRATALLRHLLVVDEVHASDTYMNRLLESVLERHVRAGGHALLLSATLGGEARQRLLNAGGVGASTPELGGAVAAPYPLVARRISSSAQAQEIPIRHAGRSREVHISMAPDLEFPDKVAARACEAASAGAKVLVVRNTVADCVATQLALETAAGADSPLLFRCQGSIAPHHGRFSRDDRRALDDALEAQIGKERSPGGCAVIATQTVQQSLDIDVDFLITDLCPIDVLLQRIGRLHRHEERPRPPAFTRPRVVVIVPTERDLGLLLGKDGKPKNHHGLGSVYHDLCVLEATWRIVEHDQEWHIPEMNRALVERGLHSTVLNNIASEKGVLFQTHEQYLLGEWLGHRRLAELNLVDWNKPYSEMTFPSSVDERIQTRLGEGDRRVQFDPPIQGPFGSKVKELSIRAWWTRGVANEAVTEDIKQDGKITRFRFGTKHFIYDRFGLRIDKGTGEKPEENVDDDGP